MRIQDPVHLIGGLVFQAQAPIFLPKAVRPFIEQLGVEGLLVVTHGMGVLQEAARGSHLVDGIQGQGFLIDHHTPSGGAQKTEGLVGHDLQLQRSLQTGIHKPDVVDDVGPVEQGGHEADGTLHAGLVIQNLGIGGAAQAEYRQIVVFAHTGGHALLVSQHVVAHHGFQVVGAAVPSRHGDRRTVADQLREHHTQQDTGVHGGHASGNRGRCVDAAGVQGDPQLGQPFFGQVDALLQGLLVGHQPGCHVDVAGGKWITPEGIGAPGHGFAHLNGGHTAFEIRRDEHDGLGGVVEHHFHLVAVVDALVHVLGQEQGHDEIDFRQEIHHRGGGHDILEHRCPAFARVVVQHGQAVRTAAVVGVVSPGPDGRFFMPVIQGQAARRRSQRPGHHVFGDANADAVGRCAAGHQDLPGLFVVDIHTGALQNLQRSDVDAIAFLMAHAGIVGAGQPVFMCWYHLPPFLIYQFLFKLYQLLFYGHLKVNFIVATRLVDYINKGCVENHTQSLNHGAPDASKNQPARIQGPDICHLEK